MPSPFVHHLLGPLNLSRSPSPLHSQPHPGHSEAFQPSSETTSKETLRSLLISLNQPLSGLVVVRTVESLEQLEQSRPSIANAIPDTEEIALKQAIVRRLVIGLYAESLEVCISQATDAETEAEWWADIGRSRPNLAWYLLQSTFVSFCTFFFFLFELFP